MSPIIRPYYLTHSPPFPGCHVTVSWGNHSTVIPAIFDTGADCTFIPVHLRGRLNLRQTANAKAVTIVAPSLKGKQPTGFYVANLAFLGLSFPNHPVQLLNWDEILIGRDIINRYHITLDGIKNLLTIV